MEPKLIQAGALIVLGYLAGSLPFGVIVARLTGGRDPRTVGSGRTGGTNALRAMGPWRAVLIAALDIAKGAVPVLVARYSGADDLVQALTGTMAVVGAWKSIFLRFHGGRGVATGVGAMLAFSPLAVILAAPVFFGAIRLTGLVALGSLLGAAAAAGILLALVVFGAVPQAWLAYGIPAVVIVWVAHTDNIQRMLRGEERRFVFSDREAVQR